MKTYQAKIPSCTYGGEGCLEKIKEIVAKENTKRAAVFTDKGILRAGLIRPLLSILDQEKIEYHVFDGLTAEPSYCDIEKLMADVDDERADMIVAMGGGSVMDAAKLCSVLKDAPYQVKDLLEAPKIAVKKIKSVMIPTTCGTGSEATCNAIVAVPEKNIKVGIVSDSLIPDYVILEPEMIRNLPKPIIAATGVDALSHAVECYTSNKANPFSDVYAAASAKLIFRSIKRAYAYPEDMKAKTDMLLGAYYGGVAITASGTTAVHALSYPLGGKYHIPHGVSNAILFAHVMEFNKDACEQQLEELCDLVNPELFHASASDKAQYIIDAIVDIVKFTNIPTNLADFGVHPEDIDFLVDAGSSVRRLLDNNKQELSLGDIRSIYQKVI